MSSVQFPNSKRVPIDADSSKTTLECYETLSDINVLRINKLELTGMTSASPNDQSSCSFINTSSAWLILIKVSKIELDSLNSRCMSCIVSGHLMESITSEEDDDNEAASEFRGSFSICARSSAVTGSRRLAK